MFKKTLVKVLTTSFLFWQWTSPSYMAMDDQECLYSVFSVTYTSLTSSVSSITYLFVFVFLNIFFQPFKTFFHTVKGEKRGEQRSLKQSWVRQSTIEYSRVLIKFSSMMQTYFIFPQKFNPSKLFQISIFKPFKTLFEKLAASSWRLFRLRIPGNHVN